MNNLFQKGDNNMGKRYELTTHESEDRFRIRALADMPHVNVKEGDYGGLVKSEANLAQDGAGWIDYSSKVLDTSFVKDAWIKESSTLSDDSFVERGEIKNSTLFNSTFKADAVVDASRIRGCSFYSTSNIFHSELENMDVYQECITSWTVWYSIKRAVFQECVLKSVNIDNESANVMKKLVMIDVNGRINKIRTTVESNLECVRFHYNMEELCVEHPLCSLPTNIHDEKVQVVGNPKAPIRIHVPALHLYDVLIKGEARLEGEYQGIYASTIQDYSNVQFTGTAQYLEMQEFSQVLIDKDKQTGIQDIRLTGDTIYSL